MDLNKNEIRIAETVTVLQQGAKVSKRLYHMNAHINNALNFPEKRFMTMPDHT